MSKVFGEALGSLYADKYGMEVFMMRIGNVNPMPIDKRRLSIWFSPRDLAQLVSIGIDHPGIKFEIVYGISGNTRAWYDNSNADAPRLPAAGRRRDLRRGGAGEGEAGHRHGRGAAPGRRVLHAPRTVPNPAAPVKKAKKPEAKK